jgi:ketosteroid isomerase-like protein
MDSDSENMNRHVVLKYFRMIDEKDMHSLLNLFREDCAIYEPFSKELTPDLSCSNLNSCAISFSH